MASSSSDREQRYINSCSNNTMVVDNMNYRGNLDSPTSLALDTDELSQTAESYIGVANPLIGNANSSFLGDSGSMRCRNDLAQLQDGKRASGSGFSIAPLPISHSSTMNNLPYTDRSQVKKDDSKEKKLSLKDSLPKNSPCANANMNKKGNVASSNPNRQKNSSSFNRQGISNSNRQHSSSIYSSDKDYSPSKSHRRSSMSNSNLSCEKNSSNSSSIIRPSSLHICPSSPNKSQQKTTLHSTNQPHSELPNHCSRSRKKSLTTKDSSVIRKSLNGQHSASHLPHHQLPTRSKSANPSTRCHNSSRGRRKSTLETSKQSSCNNSPRLQTKSSCARQTTSPSTQCLASGYESSDSTLSIGYKEIDKPKNQRTYENDPLHNHISTSTITLSSPQANIQDSKLQSNCNTQSSSSMYPYEIAGGSQATADSSRFHSLSKEVSACSQNEVLPSVSSSSLPDTLQLGSWGHIGPQCLTRVSPTTPPRAPTPPRSAVSPHPHRRSVSPNFHRRSISPHLQPQPVSPHLPNSRRSMSPPPLPQNNLGQPPPSPTLRQRLSPRPRCARTPSPRPPLPPSSVPVEQSPPPHRTPASPHAHLNKMRGR